MIRTLFGWYLEAYDMTRNDIDTSACRTHVPSVLPLSLAPLCQRMKTFLWPNY
jgi:hypothetical protein